MSPVAILHVTSPFGGGVDRYIRDIVSGVDRPQFVWHAGEGVDVLEDPRGGRFWPLAADATTARGERLAGWLAAQGVGLVHLHQFTRAPRDRAQWVRERLGVRQVATLHDVLFLRGDAFAAREPLKDDPRWLAETARSLRESAAVLAPARWLADLASARVPGLDVAVVPHGSAGVARTGEAPRARPAFEAARPARVAAMLGAIGAHKGSRLVDDVAERLEGTGVGLVVIGYLEQQFHPGWRTPGRLFVHGAFAEGDGAALLRAYGADLVLLPAEVPEGFSYALSDAWSAGIPVLAAPSGALAERIGAHGGGFLLPSGFDGSDIAEAIRALLCGAREGEWRRVQSALAQPDPARLPRLEDMTRSLDAFYARFAIDPASPGDADAAAIESLVARNLDASLFRAELIRLADELAQTLSSLQETHRRAEAFEAQSRSWIAKLEADVRDVQAELRACTAERQQLARAADELRLSREALDRLPSPLRRLLLKLAFNARR